MALPDNAPSSEPVIADFESPYDRPTGPLEDFEAGGSALGVSDDGLDYQIWHLLYNDDAGSPTYGDFTITAETTGDTEVVLNVPEVRRVGLAFNQNMDVFIAYEDRDCAGKFYWYDSLIADHRTSTLPAGSKWLACCLDDHRVTQTGTSDIILGYIRAGKLYYRQERDRFEVERELGDVGAAILNKVGMTKNLRLKFDVREGSGVRLSEIVGDLCFMVGLTGADIDVTALDPITVRGFKSAGLYAAADSIRTLQQVYFFDMPQIDGKLVAVRRGGEIVATVTQDDLVADREFKFTDSREQGVEFPKYVRLAHANAETDYTATTARSERRSRDIKSRSEHVIESAVNHTPLDAAERVNIIHKILWAEFEGKAIFSIPESFAERVPSNLINFEVRSGVFKRMRISKVSRLDGALDCEAVIDRASAAAYGTITLPTATEPGVENPGTGVPETIAPETPSPTLTGDTTWEFMDLPALTLSDDDGLYARIAGHGDAGTAWSGARVQRQVGDDWQTLADITSAALMGRLETALPQSSEYFIDTTNTLLVSLNGTPPNTNVDLMLSGAGAWLIGNEIVQVRSWEAEGNNWRGWYLIRGRLDTPTTTHPIGTRAIYLGNPVRVSLDTSLIDTTLTLRAPSYGQAGADATQSNHVVVGRSQEEWPPEMLTATHDSPATNDWSLSWIPRHRLGNSANPIASDHFYGWRLRFSVGATTVEKTINSTDPSYVYTEAGQVTDFGSAQSSFDVEIRALNDIAGEGKALIEAVS